MPEYDEEYYKTFIGKKLGNKAYRIRGRKMSAYSESLDDTNPKYYCGPTEDGGKPDYSKIEAHPAYAATYTVPGILDYLPEVADDEGNKLVTNIYKLLHTSQEYSYDGCVPLKDTTKKVYTDGTINRVWFKGGMLWVEIGMNTTNEDKSEIYCKTILMGLLRQGGFREVFKNA